MIYNKKNIYNKNKQIKPLILKYKVFIVIFVKNNQKIKII